MSMNRHTALAMKLRWPDIVHVTAVPLPAAGLNANSVLQVSANGLTNSSRMPTCSPGRLSVIVITPSPTLSLPAQANVEPTPAGGPLNVFFTAGSSLAHGDQASQLCRSLTWLKTTTGGA